MRKLLVASTLSLVGLVAAPAARAAGLEMDAAGFVGGRFFNPDGSLGRGKNAPSTNALSHTGTFGLRLSFVPHPRIAIEAELAMAPSSTKDGSSSVLIVNYRADVLANLLTGRFRPFLLVGGGGTTSSPSNPSVFLQSTRGELHAGAGLAADIGCNWGLRVDGRVLFVPATRGVFFTEDGEILLSLYGRFGKPIVDKCDKKPAPPKVVVPPPAPPPLPPPAPPPPPVDTDKDGISDNLDKCVDKAGPSENNGCPWGDKDADGLLDNVDKCVDQPETKNGFQDEDGCPDELPQAVKELSGKLDIKFESGKSVVPASANAGLDKIARVLTDAGNTTLRVEVGAHTDDAGPKDKNVALSQARADAVKEALIKRGVSSDRIDAKGYGPDKPVGDNKTAAGKAANRRVELTILPPR